MRKLILRRNKQIQRRQKIYIARSSGYVYKKITKGSLLSQILGVIITVTTASQNIIPFYRMQLQTKLRLIGIIWKNVYQNQMPRL